MHRTRLTVALVASVGVLGAAMRLLPADSPIAWLFRVTGAGVAVLLVPGVVTTLAWRPRQRFQMPELLAIGLGVSCGLIQLLAIGAILLHWSPETSLLLLGLWTIGHAIAASRAKDAVVVGASSGQVVLLLALAGLAVVLYIAGSPFDEGEERVHVAIVERLMHLRAPALDTIYFSPGIVYTYPFPGTHYLLALVGRVGDVEALFLYHKMRGLWGCLAVLLLYGCARVLTGSARIALVTALLAVALVLNGAWGPVPGFYWAQMAPYSHASDVAMTVLLPALLLLALEYLGSSTVRERRFFFLSTLAMSLMMMVTHAREIAQYLVYLTAFAVVVLLTRDGRPIAVRAGTLVAATVAILGLYLVWHSVAVPSLDTVMVGKRRDLWDLFRGASMSALVSFPLPLLRNYVPGLGPMFLSLNPIVLLLSPVILTACRARTLLWFVGAGIAIYALIVRFPLFGVPYIYLTYFEILYSPIRNFAFFVYLLTGVTLYVVAARLAGHGYIVGTGVALLLAGTFAWLFPRAEPFFASQPEWFFVPLLGGYAIALALLVIRRDRPGDDEWLTQPPRAWVACFLALAVPLVIVTTVPDTSVRAVSWSRSRQTPAVPLATCGSPDDFCPPPKILIEFAHAEVPPEAVLAIDEREQFPPALFMPQQMVVWPGPSDGLLEPEQLFAGYYRHYRRARAAYDEQPFFNDRDTPTERAAFVRDLGVTHVLVNPRHYRKMMPILLEEPDLFAKRYDDGRWALYEVKNSAAP